MKMKLNFLVLGFLYSYRERERMLIFFEILKVVKLRLELVVKDIKLGKRKKIISRKIWKL